jgi:hypothetical protein
VYDPSSLIFTKGEEDVNRRRKLRGSLPETEDSNAMFRLVGKVLR